MMDDALYASLNSIRDDYRRRMNGAASEAERWAANGEDMEKVSIFSTESERAREAFTACNRMMKAIDGLPEERCDQCDNGVEPAWEWCPWCGSHIHPEKPA